MDLVYSHGCCFGSPAHGRLASGSLSEFHKKDFLKRIFCYCHKKTQMDSVVKDFPQGKLFLNASKGLCRLGFDQQAYVLFNGLFDKWTASQFPEADLFYGWAHHSLNTIRKAKVQGTKTIIESPNSHIKNMESIIAEEYAKLGMGKFAIHSRIKKKVLKEYEETDFISVPSSFVKNSFVERGFPEEKLIHIPYGVDPKSFTTAKKTGGPFIALFMGTLTPRKGAHYLFRAWEQLALPNAELWICGNQGKGFLEDESAMKDDSIKFKGFMNMEELSANADLFVLPSIEEGMSLAVLEAMASGIPVVVSDHSGTNDLVQEGRNGFVVSIRDVGALKEKINFFYNNREKAAKIGEAARKTAEEFSWERRAKSMLSAFQKIL